ncbi:DUF4114 domain-containing protein [Kamptonema formosum]|uniref:DUF4114 domain-containing protein n=1 Tax=Kamptonema formosum TaxID=331992 RepID=UPI0009E1EED9|nr:DUF4114 domain-containing protein [Oscillatoria sp. PCC 10802]
MQDVFNNPALTGTRRPLFSVATADPRDAFNSGQIADVTGKGYAFAFEDMQVNAGADRDYNDVIFKWQSLFCCNFRQTGLLKLLARALF